MTSPKMTMFRDDLQRLKRSQLQALAKHYGLKANGKSCAMIDKLLKDHPNGVPPIDSHVDQGAVPSAAATAATSNPNPESRASRPPTANGSAPTVPPQPRAQEARPITSATRPIAQEARAIVPEPPIPNGNAPIIPTSPPPTAPETQPTVPEALPVVPEARPAAPRPDPAERPSLHPRRSIRPEEHHTDAHRAPSPIQPLVPATTLQTPPPAHGVSRSPPNSYQRGERAPPRRSPTPGGNRRTLSTAGPYVSNAPRRLARIPLGPPNPDRVHNALEGLHGMADFEREVHKSILELQETVKELKQLAEETRKQVQAERVRFERLLHQLGYYNKVPTEWTDKDVYSGTCNARPLANGEGFEEVGDLAGCSSDLAEDDLHDAKEETHPEAGGFKNVENPRNDEAHEAPNLNRPAAVRIMNVSEVYGVNLFPEPTNAQRPAKRSRPASEDNGDDEARSSKRSRPGPSGFTFQPGPPLPPAMSQSVTTGVTRPPLPSATGYDEEESTVLSILARASKESTNNTSMKGHGSPGPGFHQDSDSLIYPDSSSSPQHHYLSRGVIRPYETHRRNSDDDLGSSQVDSSPPPQVRRDKGKQRAIE